jgi:hypothetical protein
VLQGSLASLQADLLQADLQACLLSAMPTGMLCPSGQ